MTLAEYLIKEFKDTPTLIHNYCEREDVEQFRMQFPRTTDEKFAEKVGVAIREYYKNKGVDCELLGPGDEGGCIEKNGELYRSVGITWMPLNCILLVTVEASFD